jgi:uncharacterized membrane protein YtjA (UPF0391 family)
MWLLGFAVFPGASSAVHVLILVAVIVLVVHLVQARRLAGNV